MNLKSISKNGFQILIFTVGLHSYYSMLLQVKKISSLLKTAISDMKSQKMGKTCISPIN